MWQDRYTFLSLLIRNINPRHFHCRGGGGCVCVSVCVSVCVWRDPFEKSKVLQISLKMNAWIIHNVSLSEHDGCLISPSISHSLSDTNSLLFFFFCPHIFSALLSAHQQKAVLFFAFLCFHVICFCDYFCKENSPTVISAGTEDGWRTVISTWQLWGRLAACFVRFIFTATLLIKLLCCWMYLWKGRLRWQEKSCDPDKFCPAWPFFFFGV